MAKSAHQVTFGQYMYLQQTEPSDELSNGTCGYGSLQYQWPFSGGAAFSRANPVLQGLPMGGCGTCWEVHCSSGANNQVCFTCKLKQVA